jgi:hypothetical protein
MSASTAILMHTDYRWRRRLRPRAEAGDPRNLLLAKEYRVAAAVGGRAVDVPPP